MSPGIADSGKLFTREKKKPRKKGDFRRASQTLKRGYTRVLVLKSCQKMYTALSLAALTLIPGVTAQCQAPVSWPLPTTWPLVHTHKEVEFSASELNYQNKVVNYNFPARSLRYDITFLSG